MHPAIAQRLLSRPGALNPWSGAGAYMQLQCRLVFWSWCGAWACPPKTAFSYHELNCGGIINGMGRRVPTERKLARVPAPRVFPREPKSLLQANVTIDHRSQITEAKKESDCVLALAGSLSNMS